MPELEPQTELQRPLVERRNVILLGKLGMGFCAVYSSLSEASTAGIDAMFDHEVLDNLYAGSFKVAAATAGYVVLCMIDKRFDRVSSEANTTD